MKYEPLPVPLDARPGLRSWLAAQLRQIADALAEPSVRTLHLEPRAAAPARFADGDLVYADGSNWDPGSGEGFYGREGGAWVKL
jgi:hypothetical protein